MHIYRVHIYYHGAGNELGIMRFITEIQPLSTFIELFKSVISNECDLNGSIEIVTN